VTDETLADLEQWVRDSVDARVRCDKRITPRTGMQATHRPFCVRAKGHDGTCDNVPRATWSDPEAVAELIEAYRKLHRTIALERSAPGVALPGWRFNPHVCYWWHDDGHTIVRNEFGVWLKPNRSSRDFQRFALVVEAMTAHAEMTRK